MAHHAEILNLYNFFSPKLPQIVLILIYRT